MNFFATHATLKAQYKQLDDKLTMVKKKLETHMKESGVDVYFDNFKGCFQLPANEIASCLELHKHMTEKNKLNDDLRREIRNMNDELINIGAK